jgi:FtsZ-binding cell division protein ZapB
MDASVSTQPVAAQSRGILGTVKFVTTLSVIAGLLTTNIATLTSEVAHTSLFDALKQAMSYAFTDNLAHRLLNHSPNEVRKSDVARRTTILETEKDILRRRSITLEQEKVALDQQKQKISTEHDDLKSKHQKLATDHTDLNNKHSKLSADHQQLSNKNQFRQDRVRTISGRMAPRIGGIATKSLATLPGRALPYIGVAASVAFTTWEIAELCNLMNDLDELNISFGNAFNDPNKVCGLPRPSIADFHF